MTPGLCHTLDFWVIFQPLIMRKPSLAPKWYRHSGAPTLVWPSLSRPPASASVAPRPVCTPWLDQRGLGQSLCGQQCLHGAQHHAVSVLAVSPRASACRAVSVNLEKGLNNSTWVRGRGAWVRTFCSFMTR